MLWVSSRDTLSAFDADSLHVGVMIHMPTSWLITLPRDMKR